MKSEAENMWEFETAREMLEDAELSNSYWGDRITWAEAEGGFSNVSKKQAEDWDLCACGKAANEVTLCEGFSSPIPEDEELLFLGREFSVAVNCDAYRRAAHFLIKIEARAEVVHNDKWG